MGLKIILTGATGYVGEGVLLECLASDDVDSVVVVGRRPCGRSHPKLREHIVKDLARIEAIVDDLADADACFYCAGISSAGMNEADYTVVTFDTPLAFAKTLVDKAPQIVFCHVSGASTDSSEQGRVMWARVKGKAENAIAKLPFRRVYNFRPGGMTSTPGQKNVGTGMKVLGALAPVFRVVLPGRISSMRAVGLAMIRAARGDVDTTHPASVLEVPDIVRLAGVP